MLFYLKLIGQLVWVRLLRFLLGNVKEQLGDDSLLCHGLATGGAGLGGDEPPCQTVLMKDMATRGGSNVGVIATDKQIGADAALCPHVSLSPGCTGRREAVKTVPY